MILNAILPLPQRLSRLDRRGFTMIELMVVVVIILVLATMLLPVLEGARQRALYARWRGYMHGQTASAECYALYDFQGENGLDLSNRSGGAGLTKYSAMLNNGKLEGNTTWVDGRWGAGSGKKALRFNGGGDQVKAGINPGTGVVTNGVRLSNESITVAFWCRRNDKSNGDQFIMSCGAGGNNKQLHIGFKGGNNIRFGFWGNDLDSTGTITDNLWHQVVCVYESGTNKRAIYIDGALDRSDTPSAPFQGQSNSYLFIGSIFGGGFFVGDIDELQIFARAWSEEEILANYTMGDH